MERLKYLKKMKVSKGRMKSILFFHSPLLFYSFLCLLFISFFYIFSTNSHNQQTIFITSISNNRFDRTRFLDPPFRSRAIFLPFAPSIHSGNFRPSTHGTKSRFGDWFVSYTESICPPHELPLCCYHHPNFHRSNSIPLSPIRQTASHGHLLFNHHHFSSLLPNITRMLPPRRFCSSSYFGSIPSLNIHWLWIYSSFITFLYLLCTSYYLLQDFFRHFELLSSHYRQRIHPYHHQTHIQLEYEIRGSLFQ